MVDFIEYVVSELKSKRLSKENALDLIRQFSARRGPAGKPPILHPLLHRNVSDLYRQCYVSTFNGQEFFLDDHRVQADGADSVKILPGVAYLEMARAAVADALPDMPDSYRIELRDVIWQTPIVVSESKNVFVSLSLGDAEQSGLLSIDFEIFSADATDDGELQEALHCRGSALVVEGASADTLDIESLRTRAASGEIDANTVYPAYRKMGMAFGPAHQAVNQVLTGEGEVLARLGLPSVVSDTSDDYELHPSLMDGALQAAIGLLGDLQRPPERPSMPFAVESVRLLSGCRRNMYTWIRHANDAGASDKVSKLDIDLCDEQGNVCVQLRGFSSRTFNADSRTHSSAPVARTGVVIAGREWKDGALEDSGAAAADEHHVLLCGLPGRIRQALQAMRPDVRVHPLEAASIGLAESFAETAVECYETVRHIIGNKPQDDGVLVHVVVPDSLDGKLLASLSGLLRSMALEHPGIKGQVLLVDENVEADELAVRLQEESRQTTDAVVRYKSGRRQVPGWKELSKEGRAPQSAFKESGVYLISGGLGGLGTLFAREILRKTADARVVLTGRAERSPDIDARLKALAGDDATLRRVDYRTLDLVDAEAVRHCVTGIAAAYGGLSGIIHSAGMVADNLIAKKTPEEFANVLAPKVFGAVNLDEASQDLDLDFMVLFSSGAAVMGNVGQSDYAVANGFLDQYADYRNRLVEAGQRKGKTLSINWPLWRDGGMGMPRREQDAMRELTGMHAMHTETGIDAFHRGLALSQQQIAVVEGELNKIRHSLFGAQPAPSESAVAEPFAPAAVDAERAAPDLSEQTRNYLRKQFAALLKLPYHKVDPQASLERYGVDSILAMDLTGQLEKTFGPLSKTLFFENHTIEELTDYFLRSHASTLQSLFDAPEERREAAAPAPSAKTQRPKPPQSNPTPRLQRGLASRVVSNERRSEEPIAIVGLSGRYPQSEDIDAFWDNLRDGRDCISEIPKDRWDWRDYYSEDRTVEGAHYSKWGGFITGVDEFDPLFFNIPPVDAEMIDPQERLFLQHAWMAIEDAGYTRAGLQRAHDQAQAGQVGVYGGVMYGEYQLFGAEASLQGKRIGVPVSYASIANRVSYILNLHGPSMTLDTMCSSSLTAIHLACQDLRLNRTSLALAGGVNVTIHPNKYLILSAGQYISSDGHCQSFGEGGDGYIPGEGVGVVVLKRLSEAEKDGNHIYGVIRGSALNHGGKTNGYSVPNPKAQAGVIGQALKDGGVDPRHVSYIEAHGTGTKLGDPIEISALSQVFRQHTEERQFCAIGSAKSNVGHCESAAGIAGLTKVLLQMKHGMLVPSLHASVLNPHIDFESSPFVVNRTLQPWERPEVDGRRVPRIAGISSFGAGGSNAHLIIEEYDAPAVVPWAAEPMIIPLSARTTDQLAQKVRDLLAFIERREGDLALQAMAYTLQVGREPMDHRLAFVVDSLEQLSEKLGAYLRGEDGIDQGFLGRVERDTDGMSLFSRDDDMLEAIDKWIARGKFAKLAELWVRGFDLDWRKLHTGGKPSLISLPTYPFAKNRYWLNTGADRNAVFGARAPVLHPLVHTNTSDFFQQRYASEFSGDEFFLADHRIGTDGEAPQKVLPGVAYLEMVRAAIDLALSGSDADQQLEIRNVAWAQPVVVSDSKWVSIALAPDDDGMVGFEVYSVDEEQDPVVHCQGQVVLSGASRPDSHDLNTLQARMTRGVVPASDVYNAFQAMGVQYGPTFRGVTTVHRGQDQLLAELVLPGEADAQGKDFVLHPALLDSALQAAIGLAGDLDGLPREPSVPFALDSVMVYAPCVSRMFAWVRYAQGSRAGGDISKIDIDLCDDSGQLCVRLQGLASRVIRGAAEPEETGLVLAVPAWEAVTAGDVPAVDYDQRKVVLCELPQLDPDRLQVASPGIEVERLSLAGAADAADRYRRAALACFEQLQSIQKQASQGKTLFQLVIAEDGDDALLAGLSGLIDTARLETPNLVGQIVSTARSADEHTLAQQLRTAQACPGDSSFKFENHTQHALRWQPGAFDDTGEIAFRNGGVYLITGGLGSLGLLFARDILQRTEGTTVVLTGRAELDANKSAALDALSAELSVPASRLVYRQLDLNRFEQVEALVGVIVAEFGGLTGILHSAGMIRDNFIIKKTPEEFARVLEPKVRGTLHLDLATQQMDLDFLVLFSSVASALGNVGQADYAAANGFMDRFAGYRNRLVQAGQRQGKTLSIHWPLWEEGGMQLDAQTQEMLTENSGMVPLKTATGIHAFHRCLQSDAAQALVIEGYVGRLHHSLRNRHAPVEVQAPASAGPGEDTNVDIPALQEQTQRYLIEQFSGLLQIPSHEIEAKAPLEKYGMDSVLAMKLTNELERTFGSLSKTLFFEYQTIAALARYLVKTFPDTLREKTGAGAGSGSSLQPASAAPVAPVERRLTSSMRGKLRLAEPAPKTGDDVAIIGVSGRYPQAKDLREFWRNLESGRDCITEIPAERWDHRQIFHPERNQPGKAYSKWGGFLSNVDQFDALFFNISPREAELIDPQERLCIETVWETIEDAGYSKDAIAANRVGVYVGVMWGQYELYGTAPGVAGVPSSSFASVANRVSYFFDFHGPSLALDTMCSSSLTAIHLACEEVRKGELDVAVAGGVNVSIHPNKYLSLSQGNFASSDGRCRAFGEGGDGYVPGEGVGAVLLKPLNKAVEDGDQVYAVIKASSINHGGKTNGYTVPNPVAQSDLILEALNKAKVDPATLDYIETHGTGTSLGDPIEVTGLLRAFEGADRQDGAQGEPTCAIGSVKSNIGHLESAAGIAALTKVLLQLKHRRLVPSLHADPLNPNIDFDATPLHVQRELEDWPAPEGHPRRAGVSSFGAGGSNAHLIVEEFVDTRAPVDDAFRPEAFLLSAKNRDALHDYAGRVLEFLTEPPASPLTDIAFTSQVGRTPMQERVAVIASSVPELRDRLQRWLEESRAGESASRRAVAVEHVYDGSTKQAQSDTGALIEGEAGRAFLERTLAQRDLAKLAKLWVDGVDIDWAPLYRGERPRRVSLPTYPFQRERFWIDIPATSEGRPAPTKPRQMLYYRTAWQSAPLSTATGHDLAAGPLLVLGADDALFGELEREFPGGEAVVVRYGNGYQRMSANEYCVAPGSEADLTALIEDLASTNALPAAIAHVAAAGDELTELLDCGVYALHGVCRALMKHKPKHAVRIVSLRTRAPAAAEALHQGLVGYLKSLALENPKFGWKVVSVAASPASAETARILAGELRDDAWQDNEVRFQQDAPELALNRETRTVQRYTPSKADNAGAAVKQHGVYLVTGGLGGLGYVFSEHLAQRYGARLVLTGRSALDGRLQAKLDALHALGGDAVYVQADVADAAAAETAVSEAKTRFGAIDGIIHSAGVHRDAFVLNKSRDEMATVLAAKVTGTLNLDQATRREDLDLFVLFASVAGVFGNPGQADYAFANGFMDAFAARRQVLVDSGERSGRTLSIDWPFWEEGGMQIAESDLELTESRTGIAPLPTQQGLRYWDTFLQGDETQNIALYGDAATIETYLARGDAEKTSPASTEPAEAIDVADEDALREAVEGYLKTLLSEEIKLPVERIDEDESFDAFGVDSMMISRINDRLERDLGELPKTLFYEYVTIGELAGYLMQQARPALARRLEVQAPAKPAAHGDAASVTAVHRGAAVAESAIEPAPETAEADDRVAIIGVDGRFPHSDSLAEYWRNLRDGRDLIDLVPEDRWDREAFFDGDPEQAADGWIYCKWGGFLDDVDAFDAAFFHMEPDDARVTDPQERLFIQSVWAALEDAGYTRDGLKKRHPKAKSADTGVFVGVTTNSYHQLTPEEWSRGNMVNAAAMPWSIANRISYFFDFQGPSMPIDTACSSSLAAIHLAGESLKRGECQVAVAGGVNLYLHPAKYQSLCRRRMLAVDGKCRSFGDGDDGFIPGEGVGAVLLKPLAKAIEDRDHIYGVVAGSACDHGGRSNGYSAPNPSSQAMVIEQVLKRSGINPETIGYVEGHGTGTQMGDSLEVVSLTQAFGKHTEKKRFCPLGSVKANIGHSESAAGIAGVAKILLQFKHREIAPTIHSDEINPNIDFDNSPFYLQHAAAPWDPPAGSPRRAMINSFGAGGVNACLLLEEGPKPETVPAGQRPQLVVLSAKNGERLTERVRRLHDYLQAEADVDLARLAYTLQVGREAMEERLAVVVSGIDELRDKLADYADGAPAADVVLGHVEPHRRKKVRKQEDRARAKALFDDGDLDTLARIWVEGQDIEWDDFYGIDRPYRLPLPTYPFAKERYWVTDGAVPAQRAVSAETDVARLHPLVSRNVSTLKETGFSSSLTARAYYGRDHHVNGEPIFPGAGFLEIACVSGAIAGEDLVTRIEDIVWVQPLHLSDESEMVKTFLHASGNSAEYMIVSFGDDNERVIHAEGRLCFGERRGRGEDAPAAYAIDDLKRRASSVRSGAECYRQFEDFGFHYGSSFQSVQELHVGDGFALSRLSLAEALQGDFEHYILHPTLIDGALQTVVGLTSGGGSDMPYLPFAMDAIELLRPLPATCYAYVEHAVSADSATPEIKQFNIRLLSENGQVLVRMNNFYVRALPSAASPASCGEAERAALTN